MDRMQATPRVNPTIGGLADLLAASYSPQRTQQLQGLMKFLGVPDVAQTLDRISYGEPITTGAGMTTSLRPEAKNTLGALLGLVPIGRATAPAAEAATMAAGRAGERIAERAVPRVMERGGLPAEMLGAFGQNTQSRIFIGPEARTWDKDAAFRAARMEKQGATPQEIWAATGTARGPDKMWRQEIDDSASRFDPESLADLKALDNFDYLKHTQPLGGTLEHSELYKAYPDVSDIPVHFMPDERMKGAYGAYSAKHNRMSLSDKLTPERARYSSLHEIQHAIQEQERFAVGGNMRDFAKMRHEALEQIGELSNQMSALVRQMDAPTTTAAQKAELKQQYDNLMSQRMALVPNAQIDPMQAYGHLMGEAEARLVQRRMNLTPEQRRQNFPFQYTGDTGLGFDVDPAKMILMTPEGQILERGLLGSIGR